MHSLLILDEPTAALGGEETDKLFAQIAKLKAEGVSFIYISHRLDEIARVADRIAVLRDGALVASHNTAQVPIQRLVEQMVGRPLDRMFPHLGTVAGEPVLKVERLSGAEGAFSDVSFEVHAGEVFGIAGIIGRGPDRAGARNRWRRSDCGGPCHGRRQAHCAAEPA